MARRGRRPPAGRSGAGRTAREVGVPDGRGAAWLDVAGALVAAVIAFLPFLPVFDNQFVNFDDTDLLVYNPFYRGLSPAHLGWMVTTFHMGHYMPLTWLSYGLDYVAWGMDPFGYHLTNLLLHAANAALFFLIGTRLIGMAMPALRAERVGLRLAALSATLVFATHPLRVESVAWATERRDVLCAFFYLLAILAYLNACDGPARAGWAGRRWYAAAIVAHAAALLAKSMAVSLPVVLLCLDLYPLRRLVIDRDLLRSADRRRALIEKIPFFVLSAGAGVMAIVAIRHLGNLSPLGKLGVLDRLGISAYSLLLYLRNMLVPVGLSPLYELPDAVQWWNPRYALSLAAVLAITVATVRLRRRWPALIVVWASYVIILLPVSGLVQNGPQIAADRYTYLAGLGWALLAGSGMGAAWLAIRRARPVSSVGWWLAPFALVVSVGLGVLTWRQAEAWRTTETLWTHARSASPSAMAYDALGNLLAEKDRRLEAIALYEQGLRIKPGYGPGHISLGVALYREGRVAEAISQYEEAARLMPAAAIPLNNLGTALLAQGRPAEALERYRQALLRAPADPDIHHNYGRALAGQGRVAEAIEQYLDALRWRPDHAGAHADLGIALAGQGRMLEALPHFRETVKLQPENAEARNNLGLILVKVGRPAEAEAEFREALVLDPDLRDARRNLETLIALRRKETR